jgi:RNA recognition motif-containing protein
MVPCRISENIKGGNKPKPKNAEIFKQKTNMEKNEILRRPENFKQTTLTEWSEIQSVMKVSQSEIHPSKNKHQVELLGKNGQILQNEKENEREKEKEKMKEQNKEKEKEEPGKEKGKSTHQKQIEVNRPVVKVSEKNTPYKEDTDTDTDESENSSDSGSFSDTVNSEISTSESYEDDDVERPQGSITGRGETSVMILEDEQFKYTVFITNINPNITEDVFARFVSSCGEIR